MRDLIYEPKSIGARVVISLWLILSTAFMVLLTSLVTSVLTYTLTLGSTDIKTPTDMSGKTVAINKGSAAIDVARRLNAKVVTTKSGDEAKLLVEQGKAFSTIGDYTPLVFYAKSNPSKKLRVASFIPKLDEYAFVVSKKSTELKQKINKSLLNMQSSGFAYTLCEKYLGASEALKCDL